MTEIPQMDEIITCSRVQEQEESPPPPSSSSSNIHVVLVAIGSSTSNSPATEEVVASCSGYPGLHLTLPTGEMVLMTYASFTSSRDVSFRSLREGGGPRQK